MEDIIIIAKSLEESGLFIKVVIETIENEAKEQNGLFLSMVLDILGSTLLENMLPGKRVKTKRGGNGVIIAGDGVIRTSNGTSRDEQDL